MAQSPAYPLVCSTQGELDLHDSTYKRLTYHFFKDRSIQLQQSLKLLPYDLDRQICHQNNLTSHSFGKICEQTLLDIMEYTTGIFRKVFVFFHVKERHSVSNSPKAE
jgi:hypothetical protein